MQNLRRMDTRKERIRNICARTVQLYECKLFLFKQENGKSESAYQKSNLYEVQSIMELTYVHLRKRLKWPERVDGALEIWLLAANLFLIKKKTLEKGFTFQFSRLFL